MRILNLFLDFQSDVRFRRNDGFKIARHFESLALLCVCGFLSLVLYCSAMYAGGHVVCVKKERSHGLWANVPTHFVGKVAFWP